MARSITFKFGADTSQLTRALGSVRKSIGGMMGGLTSVRGMLGAGIAGFGASQLIGGAMNISPTFANAMLELEEGAVRGLAAGFMQLEPHILALADELPALVAGIGEAAAAAIGFYKQLQEASGGFGEAAGKIVAGDIEGGGRSAISAFGTVLNTLGLTDVAPEALAGFASGGMAGVARAAVENVGGQARTQTDPARSADPRP